MNGEKLENVWAAAFDVEGLNFPANNCMIDSAIGGKIQNWGTTHDIRKLFSNFSLFIAPTLASCKVVQSCA